MAEIAAKNLLGLPVYSVSEGEEIGHIRRVIINPQAKGIMGLAVDTKSRQKDLRLIAFEKVHGIGNDAVTIGDKENAQKATSLPQMLHWLQQPMKIVGSRIITEGGSTLGRAEEYYIDCKSGIITRLDITGKNKSTLFAGKTTIKGEHIITIGAATIVVKNEAAAALAEQNNNLKQTMAQALEKAGKIAQGTKQWGQNLAAAVEKATEKEATVAVAPPSPSPEPENKITEENQTPVETIAEETIKINQEDQINKDETKE